mgnify:CR=1 FL=1
MGVDDFKVEDLQFMYVCFVLSLGEFTTYGTDVLAMTELNQEEREDPMARVINFLMKLWKSPQS